MTAKPVVPREQANRDIDDAIAYYLSESAEQAAFGFIDALEQAYAHIGRHPAIGSPRYAHELNLPGLRFLPLAHYSHLVFYVERPEHIVSGACCTANATSLRGCRSPTPSSSALR